MPPQVDGGEVSFHLTGRGQRSELEPDLPAVHEGDEHDLTFSLRLDGEFPLGSTRRQVIARWENDSPGQAPLDLRVSDGELVLHGGEGHPSGPRPFTRALGRAPIGEWTQLRVEVRFSADPAKAGVSVWRDGRPVVDDEHPVGGTLYPGQQSYLKVGLHRDPTISRPSTVRFRAWRLDHCCAVAEPRHRDAPSGHDMPAGERSPDAADRVDRSSPSDTSLSERSEVSSREESRQDLARRPRAVERDTSQASRSHRKENAHRSTAHRSTGHRSFERSPTSKHRGAEDSSTSQRHSEPTRRSSRREASQHRVPAQADPRRGTARHGLTAGES